MEREGSFVLGKKSTVQKNDYYLRRYDFSPPSHISLDTKNELFPNRCTIQHCPATFAMQRHFAGRPPADSDSDEEVERPAAPARRRARFVARVISDAPKEKGVVTGDEEAVKGVKAGRFVRVSEREMETDGAVGDGELSSEGKEEADDSGQSSDSSGSQSESGEEESEEEEEPLFRPVFVKAPTKKDVVEVDTRAEQRMLQRREEAKQLVVEAVHEEDTAVRKEELPDDTDRAEDGEKEVALWRLRELKRVMRDRELSERWEMRGEDVVVDVEDGLMEVR